MKVPTVSVIMATYNHAPFVARAIESVLGQNYRNIEYIIIDGLSTDSTLDIVAQYQEDISTIISEVDSGFSKK